MESFESGIIGPIIVMLRSACDAVRSVGRFERFIRDGHFRQLCGLNTFQREFEMVSIVFSITVVYKKENQVKQNMRSVSEDFVWSDGRSTGMRHILC